MNNDKICKTSSKKDKENDIFKIIKVNKFSNDDKKAHKLNIEINEKLLSDDNDKIDTHVPIPESRPKAYQSPIKYKEPKLATFTPIKNKTLNSSRVNNTSGNMNINIINTNNTLFNSERKKSNNSNFTIDSIFDGINSTRKYNFDLYKHLKNNISFREKLCQDSLSKNSYYCIDCKMSTCPKCPNFEIHNSHELVQKYQYYECDSKLINDYFSDIDKIFDLNPDFLNVTKVKEELKEHVINHVTQLFNKLTEIKTTKLREIEYLFADTENCVETLKNNIIKIKEDLNKFISKQKTFFCYNLESDTNSSKLNSEANEIVMNLQEGAKISNIGLIKKNNDAVNSGFLIVYDLLKNTQSINQEIKYFFYDIKINREKFLEGFTRKTKWAYESMQNLLMNFDGNFKYPYLMIEFYQIIYDKMNKYNEKIDLMKKRIFELVNDKGNFEDVEKQNKIFGTYINQKFENILKNQLIDEDEAATVRTLMTKTKKKRKSLTGTTSKMTLGTVTKQNRDSLILKGENNENKMLYTIPEEIVLNKQEIQDYFSYEIFNTVHDNFKLNKKKEIEIEEDFDEEVDLAKPIPTKNEMHVYDRKNKVIIKKVVKFDKKIHKYLYFLNGCRTVLIKDKLYIFGGVDKENNISKIAYVYYINSNELKMMPEMLKPHAYHSVQFLDYYKSIVIIGGENSKSCELYDLSTGLWTELPEMNTPRANCILYLDKITHIFYAFFGILGKIAERNNNFTDILECLEFRKLALGWNKIEYNNKAQMNFRTGINQIYPLSPEIILVYGGTNIREFIKKAAVYLLSKQEMSKIDNKIFNEIREASKTSKKLYKILNSTD